MKKTNRKGFTIVELVIVIAVIAILAAVLIPTFSNVVEKANQSAALQEATNTMKEDLVVADADYANIPETAAADDYKGVYNATAKTYTYETAKGYTCVYSIETGAWTVTKD